MISVIYIIFISYTDSNSGNSDSEFAKSFAKTEIGVGNIDPLVAQKRAIMVCKLEQLKNESTKMKVSIKYVQQLI